MDSVVIDESLIINAVYYEQLKDQLTCTICTGLLINPLMCSKCETAYCASCIQSWMKKTQTCPMRCTSPELKDPNRSIKKILDGLKLKCKYGCEVSLLSYLSHVKSCEDARKEVVCWNCGKTCLFPELKIKSKENYEKYEQEITELKAKIAKYEETIAASSMQVNSASISLSLSSLLNASNSTNLLKEADVTLLKSWIGSNCSFQRIYKGSVDGFSASAFHQKCDKTGHTVTAMRTSFKKIIGGFSVVDWDSPSPSGLFYKDFSNKCFLFSLTLKEKYPLKGPDELAVCSNKNYGPIFGNYDLLTVNNCNLQNCGNYDIGTVYQYKHNTNKQAFYGGTPYKIEEIEVYQVTY